LWIAGVPFMDSLSFTFLSFISYEFATLLLSPLSASRGDVIVLRHRGARHSLWTAALAGFLMMYLDIIIDPVTLQGKRWFLGQIYYYPAGGAYFGVTIANFLGWFIVCLVIVLAFIGLERLMGLRGDEPVIWRYRFQALSPVALYFGVLGFNLWVTFQIGETTLGWAGIFICLPLLLMMVLTLRRARNEEEE
jgi:putative membrane protein